MRGRLHRVVCRVTTHDWWAVAYPPARRWECHRCGAIVEEPPSLPVVEPARRRTGRRPEEADPSRSS